MKKLLLGLTIVLGVLISGINVSAEELVYAQVEAFYNYDEAYKLMDLINDYRAENGLTRLETNDKLMKIAMQRALECNVYFEHDSPTGKGECQASITLGFAIGPRFDYDKNAVINDPEWLKLMFNENIYATNLETFSVNDALKWWQNSAAHNDHILNRNDHSNDKQFAIGVGIVNGCAVMCIFHNSEAIKTDNNTKLANYSKTETVPVLKSLVDSNKAGHNEYVTIKDTDSTEDEKDEEDKKEEAAKKEVQNSKVSGLKLTKKKSGHTTKITVKFSKVKGCKYQVQVANNKQFKNAKKCSVSNNKKTVSVKYKGKKAYVRIRCYKVVDGKTVYGKWSAVKNIKTYK